MRLFAVGTAQICHVISFTKTGEFNQSISYHFKVNFNNYTDYNDSNIFRPTFNDKISFNSIATF